ncbi:T9SS type A sorting domain-containing protein [Dyadobacter chenwenxiniae]|uniref:T9SS type A sorting domain-containing protein n=1 Tax=Dyadobacter chenwenxiniae TaxID=2906456 RepID=A0A9X1PLV0_9BACT|nr:T9SS type A sorting domain-containing protein [Dyadobacter chenwenxiniae]MCF0063211.1 T9SS type A sorting domain-containing protein [Dyadobacter chenwenxiniae]UON85409.1 T9SS type A sorting domain-containing protein [Dyadobacter chenwenxiniae]
MKHYLLFCLLAPLCSFNATAQFTSGTEGFYTSPGTDVCIDGLTFRPTAAFGIVNNTLTISPTALPGSPPSIARVYTFDSPVTFTGRLGLFYLASELNRNTETMLQVAYQNAAPVTTIGSVVNNTSHYIYNDLLAPITFRTVTAAQHGALPVTLLEFKAKKEGSAASLNWSTTYESNSDYFNVEHSSNAKDWNTLSKITAANQSNGLKNYGFSHGSPAAGTNYYRLKMVDKDQSYAYSTIRELHFEQSYQIALYPNPAVDKVRISMDHWDKIATVKLLGAQGNTLLEFDKKPLSKEINIRNFPAGLYVVQLLLKDGSTAAVKVIKQ